MSLQDFSVLLPVIVLAAGACLVLLVDLFVPDHHNERSGWLALLVFGGAAASLLAWPRDGVWEGFGGMIVADGFSTFLTALFIITGAMGTLLAINYMSRMGTDRGEYFVLLLLSVAGMVLMSQARDLIIIFLALELLSIPLYVLAGIMRPRLSSEESALKYFLLGSFATGFVVYGIALVYGALGTTNLATISTLLVLAGEGAGRMDGLPIDTTLLAIGSGVLLVGLGFKVGAVPFHMWTPDVYEGAPSAVTAFMTVGAKAGGFAAILRVFVEALLHGQGQALTAYTGQWVVAIAILAGLTVIIGNVAAIVQSNIKRMLAYSSIAHGGYLLMALPAAALGAQNSVALTAPGIDPKQAEAMGAILFYLFTYALTILGAWAVVMTIEKRKIGGESGGLSLDDYRGLWSRRPGLALAMALFMFSLTGLPPTAGFAAKYVVFSATLAADLPWLAVIGVLTSVVSAYYYLRVVVLMFMRPGQPTVFETWSSRLAVGVMALATLAIGLFPHTLLQLAQRSVTLFR
jgi:NADH-quinone oxidoreductase subunit N